MWVDLVSEKSTKSSTISMALCLIRSIWHVSISMPSALAGQFGYDAVDSVGLALGSGEHAGKLRITETGEFKLRRLKFAVSVRCPPFKGVRLVEKRQDVTWRVDGGAVIIDLPEFLIPPEQGSVVVPSAADRPAALEVNGTTLVMGAREVMLTASQAVIVGLLVAKFGAVVRRQEMLDALYSADPNGGADDRIIDVWISKLRSAIDGAGLPLMIRTHHRVGFELQRKIA